MSILFFQPQYLLLGSISKHSNWRVFLFIVLNNAWLLYFIFYNYIFPIIVRLYDVQTCRCYVSAVPEDQHLSAVNMVRWSPNGTAFVTAGMDGSFKIWDGVSCRCVNTFEAAHDGAPVCSVVFSRNGKVCQKVWICFPLYLYLNIILGQYYSLFRRDTLCIM